MPVTPKVMTDLATTPWLTVMGFDYGHKRLGIAVGQTLTATAQPLATVHPTHWPQIDKFIQHWQPQACIVGQPHCADGRPNAITVAVTEFTQKLYQRYQLPVHTIDETLSSVSAAQRISKPRRKKTSATQQLDAVAAQIILETWFTQCP